MGFLLVFWELCHWVSFGAYKKKIFEHKFALLSLGEDTRCIFCHIERSIRY
jgi:hypothetical protein